MADEVSNGETREDILHVPNLFEYFCARTADDMRSHGKNADPPAISFASLIVTVMLAFAFYVFNKPGLAKATFVLFGLLLLWTIWGVVVRSSEQINQKADDIRAGNFPPASAPFVLARLKWWNHLVVPQRWGKHSRLFDRRGKLERKIEELERKIAETTAKTPPATPYVPPSETEIFQLADSIQNFKDRNEYELEIAGRPTELERLRAELVLYQALMYKLTEMGDKLDKIESLSLTFHAVTPEDLSNVVQEATQMLEERRLLVLSVDSVDPDDFIDLVTVRVAS